MRVNVNNKMLVKFISILLVLGAVSQANCFNGRIVNGEEATEVVPYHAQLEVRLNEEPERAGSGVIISLRLVMTAASNIYNFNIFRAGFGSIYRNSLTWKTAILAQTISSYNPVTYENNVGFIIFEKNAFLHESIVPISIPPISTLNLPLENEQGLIVGFGWTQNGGNELSDTLQIAFNRVISRAECASYYVADQDSNFCAIDKISSSKICAGDQGSAFVTNINEQNFLTGIASYMYKYDCVPDVPALFVRTIAFRDYVNVMTSVFS